MTVFSRIGLMPVLPPVPYARQALWIFACVVPLLILTGITEFALRKPLTAPLVKTVERHPVLKDEPISEPGEPVLTFEQRWSPVQNQWGESRKPFMAIAREDGRPPLTPAPAAPAAPAMPATHGVLTPEPEQPAPVPNRRTERRLAQQEVCATHGLRKVWVSRWRWRCQH